MNYTSIEQSKKLLELGLGAESADMYWAYTDKQNYVGLGNPPCDVTFGSPDEKAEIISCWSVGALIALLPLGTTIHSYFTSVGVAYEIYTEKERFERLSLFEALYDIIEWLLKQGCIKH